MAGGLSVLAPPQERGHQRFRDTPRILGPSWARFPIMTVGLLGMQIVWCLEMTYASPYLLSLGLSKSSMAIVFVAGPLSGLIMQPLIGILADKSTSSFGRRRPYMLVGTVICIMGMLLLGFTRPVASIFTGWDNTANNVLTVWLAIFSIYLIDFSINAVMAVDRALLVDTLPPAAQSSANAWAARMVNIGGVVGFFVGNIDVTNIFAFFGHTQLQILSVIVSLLLLSGHLATALLVKERVLLKDDYPKAGKSMFKSFTQELYEIWDTVRTLPRVIRQILLIQFFSSFGWFPLLFYSTIYMGDIYKQSLPSLDQTPANAYTKAEIDAEGTRLGSRALFYSSLLSLFVNIVAPLFVADPGSQNDTTDVPSRQYCVPKWMKVHLATLWAFSYLVFAACMGSTLITHSVFGATLGITMTGIPGAIGSWASFSLLSEAILTSDERSSDIDMAEVSYTAIPFSDIRTNTSDLSTNRPKANKEEEREALISVQEEKKEEREDEDGDSAGEEVTSSFVKMTAQDLSEDGGLPKGCDMHHRDPEEAEVGYDVLDDASGTPRHAGGSLSSKTGVILGINNIVVVIPQFLVTGLSAVVFAIFDPPKSGTASQQQPGFGSNVTLALGEEMASIEKHVDLAQLLFRRVGLTQSNHLNPVVYTFLIGGVAAAIACVLTFRLARDLRYR